MDTLISLAKNKDSKLLIKNMKIMIKGKVDAFLILIKEKSNPKTTNNVINKSCGAGSNITKELTNSVINK